MQAAFDIQVNGFAGVDFNSLESTPEDFHRACAALRANGFDRILAAIITADVETMVRRLKNVASACEADDLCAEVIAGIHIEGPFLNPTEGFAGAHPPTAMDPADLDLAEELLEAANGQTRLVTLAPEQDAPDFSLTRMLRERGIAVAAGHTNATTDQLRGAIDAGLSLFTHLGNGCPSELPRHDNIIQRALALSDDLWICLIPDGQHVPIPALSNYLRAAGVQRCIFTSDAMAGASGGQGMHRLAHLEIEVREDGIARLPGTYLLAGSTATAESIRTFSRRQLGLSEEDIDALTYHNPLAALTS